MLGLDPLQLDGHLLPGGNVRPEVNVTEGATPYLPAQSIFITNSQLHRHQESLLVNY